MRSVVWRETSSAEEVAVAAEVAPLLPFRAPLRLVYPLPVLRVLPAVVGVEEVVPAAVVVGAEVGAVIVEGWDTMLVKL